MSRFGIILTHHDDAFPPHAVAQALEARGFDSLYVPENTHVPLDRPNTIRQFDGIERLARFYDPFTALSACAAVTERLHLGTSVSLLTQREPILTAQAIASLDHLAGGRLTIGIAGGFIAEAMEAYGSGFRARWHIVRERALAMRRIWCEERPSFSGEHVNFAPLRAPVRPYQRGGPPLMIGSNSKWVPARVADYADGWMTLRGRYPGDPLDDLKAACASAGRDFAELSVSLLDAPDDAGEAAASVARGYNELVWFSNETSRDALLGRLDRLAGLANTLRAG